MAEVVQSFSKNKKEDEWALKSAMPADCRKILESNRLCLVKHIIQGEQYEG